MNAREPGGEPERPHEEQARDVVALVPAQRPEQPDGADNREGEADTKQAARTTVTTKEREEEEDVGRKHRGKQREEAGTREFLGIEEVLRRLLRGGRGGAVGEGRGVQVSRIEYPASLGEPDVRPGGCWPA